MKLSVIIPAYNEENSLAKTVHSFYDKLLEEKIEHEILVINDNSTDNTLGVLENLKKEVSTLRYLTNFAPNGYGYACQKGLNNYEGDCVAVTMADLSDDPADLVNYFRTMQDLDCDMVFGSRWMKGAKVVNYPKNKLWLNRLVNHCIRFLFMFRYNDVTNGFKLFKRSTMDGLKPFISGQFSLALELPLKAIVRGYDYTVVPNNWYNREIGISNLKLKAMFCRYTFILLYCLNERLFSMGDYKKEKYNLPRTSKK
ncbi:MAG: glycosyltransferase family 2 protein [Bacteroidetes bacterium]|nr:glycosyltransferase family 2 protein [Bacteroidota bacterium]